MPRGESDEPDEESSGVVLLQRWVERPDGSMELLEKPLTPEEFLDPQSGDKWMQGLPHSRFRRYLAEMLDRHFRTDEDVLVLEDMKHLLGPGLPGPAPDVSVVRGARDPDPLLESFDLVAQGVAPCLVIEIVSPSDYRIRRTDEKDKVLLYAQVGIPEYLLVDLPRKRTGYRAQVRGLRLGADGRYHPIQPDGEGRLLSETTGLLFGVSPQGDRIDLFDARTGERLLNPVEEEEGHKAERAAREAAEKKAAREAQARRTAEKQAARETQARKAAEEELLRLRAEIERLRKS